MTDWTSEPGVAEAFAARDTRHGFDPERLAAAVWGMEEAARELDEAALGVSSSSIEWPDLATLIEGLRRARTRAHAVESSLETQAAAGMIASDTKAADVPGVGRVEWRRGATRKQWQHDTIAQAVLDARLAETGGEMPDPWTVRDWLTEAAHIDYWRVGVLKGLGIDPADVCDTEPGKVTLDIVTPD